MHMLNVSYTKDTKCIYPVHITCLVICAVYGVKCGTAVG